MADSKNNETLLIGLHSFGSITYYLTLIEYNKLKFELYEHFRKGSYASRYFVAGPNGHLLLSIPVVHDGRDRTGLAGIRIANRDRWQTLHWRTLTSAYRRSPWFEFYEDELRPLYTEPFEYLVDWNRHAFTLVTKWLDASWELSFTTGYEKHYPEAGIVDGRELIMPASERAAAVRPFPAYRQVFGERTGFIGGLSILDLLFSEGRRAAGLLQAASGGDGVRD